VTLISLARQNKVIVCGFGKFANVVVKERPNRHGKVRVIFTSKPKYLRKL